MRGSGLKTTVAPEGQRIAPSDALNTTMATVSREYFDVVGMKLLSGRQFLTSDFTRNKTTNVVVNEAFVRHFFPATDPLGRTFGGGPNGIAQGYNRIVGVVSDAKFRSMREPIQPTFFVPSLDTDFTLYVRTRTRPEELIQPVRQALSQLDPAMPFTEIHTLEEEIEASTAPERLTSQLASAFSLTAALLAAVGIYGLFAFAVGQRKREIGVRMAVGASPNDIAGMFGLQALLTAVAGIAIGTAISLVIAPAVASILYGIPPRDPRSFVFAGLSMLLAALAATAIPAIRAALIHPAEALRQE
jgi:ABC-type antimicrobial peptide transport system permease subunit